jgi:hypothetical protein
LSMIFLISGMKFAAKLRFEWGGHSPVQRSAVVVERLANIQCDPHLVNMQHFSLLGTEHCVSVSRQ